MKSIPLTYVLSRGIKPTEGDKVVSLIDGSTLTLTDRPNDTISVIENASGDWGVFEFAVRKGEVHLSVDVWWSATPGGSIPNFDKLFDQYQATQEKPEPNWDKAPDGATHWQPECEEFHPGFMRITDNGELWFWGDHHDGWVGDHGEFAHLSAATFIPRPASHEGPVQEPQWPEPGSLPPVGEWCEYLPDITSTVWVKCRILAHLDGESFVAYQTPISQGLDRMKSICSKPRFRLIEPHRNLREALDTLQNNGDKLDYILENYELKK